MPVPRGVLIDLGGVVYVGNSALPGAIGAVERLRNSGLGVRFLTNTTRTAHRQLLGNLLMMGLTLDPSELFTPALAARAWLEERKLAPLLLVHPALLEDFAGLPQGGRDVVVIGDAGQAFSYDALNRAFRALQDGAAFLSLAENRFFRDADGGMSLDAGPFVAALAFATRRPALALGKPAPAFFHSALASLACESRDAVMIGDDVEADVEGAMAAGLAGVLVRTGKYQPGAEQTISPPPSAVTDDLGKAADLILSGSLG